MDVGIGLSTEKDPIFAAKEAIKLAISNKHKAKIDLAIVFGTTNLSSISLLKAIHSTLEEPVPIIGCSSQAVISNQGVFKHGLIVALLSFSEDVYFNTAYIKETKAKPSSLNAGRELGGKLLYRFKTLGKNLALIISDRSPEESTKLIYGLQEILGRSFPMVGASVSDNMRFQKSYLYFNQEILTDSAVGLLWGGKLNFGLGIKHGWKPLGKPRTVTAAEGNIVYEIDGESAAKIYEEYFACKISELQNELRYITALYPIGIYLTGEEEYLLRNILSIEENGSLIFQGNVGQGSQIRLMIGTRESALLATQQAILEAKKNLAVKPNLILVLDSISRYILLKRNARRELEIISDAVDKGTPIIGLYTYGEQAPLKAVSYQGQVYFHNQTITILAIGG